MGRTPRRPTLILVLVAIFVVISGCAQSQQQGNTAENDPQLAEAIQNYENGAPMNGREISNGPGIFTGREGGFVIFRK
jgi:hypothetical protein